MTWQTVSLIHIFEIVISWIVQDMFVSRKGDSYNIEEFDQLPDTFFEPNEWKAFLFNRNNPIWINIAKECAKFKRCLLYTSRCV